MVLLPIYTTTAPTIPQIDAKVNTKFSFSTSFTQLGTVTFMGLGMMLIGSSWQTATLQSYSRARVKGVWVYGGRSNDHSNHRL